MWADNEADLDLLGFDFLVDELVVALTEPRLLPVTIGVLGDWGSGKSSLMQIASQELNDLNDKQAAIVDGATTCPYLTINFGRPVLCKHGRDNSTLRVIRVHRPQRASKRKLRKLPV